jgi:lipoprotein NlpI
LEKREKPGGDWAAKPGLFLLDRMDEAALLAAAADPNAEKQLGQQCEAWYYAGMKRLLAGDKPAAAERFRKCLATEKRTFVEYQAAQAELKALEK